MEAQVKKVQDPAVRLAELIRPAYQKALAEGTFAVSVFHRDFGPHIKEWKDLTGKQFPADF